MAGVKHFLQDTKVLVFPIMVIVIPNIDNGITTIGVGYTKLIWA